MNSVLICIDCLREDILTSQHTNTPFIDSLIADGVYFSSMYSSTTTTTPSVASFMTGCYSERNGVNSHDNVSLNPEVPTLAEVFQESGYSTYAMATGPVIEETDLDRGFEKFWYRDRNKGLFDNWRNSAQNKINNLSEPFFLYLHLWEIHDPIEVPPKYDHDEYGRFPYERALSALDRELKKVYESLPHNTMLFLHGDHGESITWRHSSIQGIIRSKFREKLRYDLGLDTRPIERYLNKLVAKMDQSKINDHFIELGHGENIFDFATNVPFLIYGSEMTERNIDNQVRQVDVFPTILKSHNLKRKKDMEIHGKSLLDIDNLDDRDAYIRACGLSLEGKENWQRGLRADNIKYVEYPNTDLSAELYDLENDPNELHPIEDEEIMSKMRERIPDEDLMDVNDLEIDDLLRDLGYL